MKLLTAIRFAAMLIAAAVFFLIPMAIALPLPQRGRRVVMFYPWFGFAYVLRWIFSAKVTVEGREFTGSRFERNHLFICNHLSMADIPLLVSVYPFPFVAKRETVRVPIIGQAGWLAGNIVFDRSNPAARKQALIETLRRIREFNSIYLFPEGTRSPTGIPKAEPYMALICAAWDEKIDVVPMAIHGSRRVLRAASSRVRVKIAAPVRCADFTNRDQFARACWNRVIDQFYELNAVADVRDRAELPAKSTLSLPTTLPSTLSDVNEEITPEA